MILYGVKITYIKLSIYKLNVFYSNFLMHVTNNYLKHVEKNMVTFIYKSILTTVEGDKQEEHDTMKTS